MLNGQLAGEKQKRWMVLQLIIIVVSRLEAEQQKEHTSDRAPTEKVDVKFIISYK